MNRIALIVGLGATLAATLPAFGQAYSVSPSGKLEQETTPQRIAPEDQATKEQLGRLFEAMHLKNQVEQLRALIPTMVGGQIKEQAQALNAQTGSNLTADQRAALERLSRKYVEKAMNVYAVDEMVADMTTLYQKYLTREDVDGMIAFYTSPAGQHLLDAQPRIAKEYMPIVMQRVQERTRGLIAEMMKEAADITHESAPAKQ